MQVEGTIAKGKNGEWEIVTTRAYHIVKGPGVNDVCGSIKEAKTALSTAYCPGNIYCFKSTDGQVFKLHAPATYGRSRGWWQVVGRPCTATIVDGEVKAIDIPKRPSGGKKHPTV